jgi:hypothetical protein
MARPRLSQELKNEIYRLRGEEGKSIDAILTEIGEKRVSRGSVGKYVKEYDNLPTWVKEKDRRIAWHRLEEYGVYGENAAYVLRLWADTGAGDLPTVRDVRWWCKVRQLAQDAPPRTVYRLAGDFIWRERLKDWGYEPPEDASVWGEIAFHAWTSREDWAKYELAKKDGRVPESKSIWMNISKKESFTSEDLLRLSRELLDASRESMRSYKWDMLLDEHLERAIAELEGNSQLTEEDANGDTQE